jgi:CBS domain-containing protein
MKVQELMSTRLLTCRSDETLNRAAQIMWEFDCGVVPVVDEESRVVGMLTDRDICMAAYTQGRPLWQIPVAAACSKGARACTVNDTLQTAEATMRTAQLHRIPVVDHDGKICGILSLSDLAQHAHKPRHVADGLSYESIASTLAAISRPSTKAEAKVGAGDSAQASNESARIAATA